MKIDVDCRTVAFCTVTVEIDESDLNDHDAVREAVLATMPDLSYEDVAAVAVLDWGT
jgi:hypothetical protein